MVGCTRADRLRYAFGQRVPDTFRQLRTERIAINETSDVEANLPSRIDSCSRVLAIFQILLFAPRFHSLILFKVANVVLV